MPVPDSVAKLAEGFGAVSFIVERTAFNGRHNLLPASSLVLLRQLHRYARACAGIGSNLTMDREPDGNYT